MWLRTWDIFDRLFFGPRSNGPGFLAACVRVLRYPYAVIRDLLGGEINLRAMGLVYTTLLSLIPLLAISFAILAAFGESRDLQPIVYEFFRPMGNPGAAEITSRVMHFVGRVSNRIVGTVGLAVLLWTLVGTIKKVEDSFNFVWRVEHARGFARRITEYVSLLIIGPILMVGFLALSHAALGTMSATISSASHRCSVCAAWGSMLRRTSWSPPSSSCSTCSFRTPACSCGPR
jgi:membrane protein